MEDLLYARSQMAMSLGFHIIFAAVGVALPAMMVVAEWKGRRTGDEHWLELARRWGKGTAILFAVGAVSGTILSFELGLLWPRFMQHAGPIIGTPFSLEGFAFFIEAIFLGIYLYGWERVSARAHLISGVIVAISGAASAFFVTLVNAWMNTPEGFEIVDGEVTNIDVWDALWTPAAGHETIHLLLACYMATAFAIAGVHAYYLLRRGDHPMHRRALSLAMIFAMVTSVLQFVSGDHSAKEVAALQPIKLAAMEGQFEDEVGAPLRLGGIPDEERGETRFAIEIPYGLSFLAYGDPNAEVRGLNSFPRDEWPPVAIVHYAFQIMVGAGSLMLFLITTACFLWWRRKRLPTSKWVLRGFVACAPLGFVGMEAGWVVTEVGRQPWIVHGVWRTSEAVTPIPGLAITFWTFTVVYILLAVSVAFLLRRQFRAVYPTDVSEAEAVPDAETTTGAEATPEQPDA